MSWAGRLLRPVISGGRVRPPGTSPGTGRPGAEGAGRAGGDRARRGPGADLSGAAGRPAGLGARRGQPGRASQLGLSVRTVQRRIHRLLALAGVQSDSNWSGGQRSCTGSEGGAGRFRRIAGQGGARREEGPPVVHERPSDERMLPPAPSLSLSRQGIKPPDEDGYSRARSMARWFCSRSPGRHRSRVRTLMPFLRPTVSATATAALAAGTLSVSALPAAAAPAP